MRSELKDFLTRRRGAIAPQSVGLTGSPGRRSQGLTREDMAELTGVSFKWYTLFESGAAKNVSRRLADRVAEVLALDAAQREYLLRQLGFMPRLAAAPPSTVPPHISRFLREGGAVPMAVYSPLFEVLECNPAYAALFPPRPPGMPWARNKLWRLFFDAAYRAAWVDWEAAARRSVAKFRYMTSLVERSAEYDALLAELRRSADFERLWRAEEVSPMAEVQTRFQLMRSNGERLAIEIVGLQLVEAAGLYLVAMMAQPVAAVRELRPAASLSPA